MYAKILRNKLLRITRSVIKETRCLLNTAPASITTNENEDVATDLRKENISKLQELFNIRRWEAQEIVSHHKALSDMATSDMEFNFKLLIDYDIHPTYIIRYPHVLAAKNTLEHLNHIMEMPLKIQYTFPLVTMKRLSLLKTIYDQLANQKLTVLSQLLRCTLDETCYHFATRSFLATSDVDALRKNVEVLTGYGVTEEEIRKDMWALAYKSWLIRERFERVRANNLDVVKTWMVRATEENFQRYLQIRADNREILGDSSLTQYLSKRLNCTENMAGSIISKHPQLKTKSAAKIEEIIDFLYAQGYRPEHIKKVPKVLLHSVETTRKRLSEVKTLGCRVESLSVMTKSQKQYAYYYDGLVKANKAKQEI